MSDELKLPLAMARTDSKMWRLFDADGFELTDGLTEGEVRQILTAVNTAAQLREQRDTLREAGERFIASYDEGDSGPTSWNTEQAVDNLRAALSGTGVSEAAKLREHVRVLLGFVQLKYGNMDPDANAAMERARAALTPTQQETE